MAQETVATDPLVARRGLTRVQYDVLVDTGVLEGEPVELLEGTLVTVPPQGWTHSHTIVLLTESLVRGVPAPWKVAVRVPLAVTDDSEPEPDLSVVQLPESGHPRTAALVIEVAVSSQRTDLVHKPRLYAAAGVEQYWVIDLPVREVVVHTGPGPSGYATVARQPWTTPLSVLGVPVDLDALITAS